MNILFLLKSIGVGGVEVVSVTLANKFVQEGINVSIFSFEDRQQNLIERLDKRIHIFYGSGFRYSPQNVSKLRSVIKEKKIDIIINQWGLPFIPTLVTMRAKQGLDIKYISFHHNAPSTNGLLKKCELSILEEKNILFKLLLLIKMKLIKYITSSSMRYVYNHSDIYNVLCNGYIEEFKIFTGIKNPSHLGVLCNPITIEEKLISHEESIVNNKIKEVLYVGRIDSTQKRVDRIIDVWSYLEKNHPDWKLTIVGDGVKRTYIEELVKQNHLKNVCFEGYQSPIPYYKRASILIMTSEYEGFPLVLAEAMNFGVIPVVFGSYKAVYDMITSGKDGMIVDRDINGLFNAVLMADAIDQIMNDKSINVIMKNAILKSQKYTVDSIFNEWNQLFIALGFTNIVSK